MPRMSVAQAIKRTGKFTVGEFTAFLRQNSGAIYFFALGLWIGAYAAGFGLSVSRITLPVILTFVVVAWASRAQKP